MVFISRAFLRKIRNIWEKGFSGQAPPMFWENYGCVATGAWQARSFNFLEYLIRNILDFWIVGIIKILICRDLKCRREVMGFSIKFPLLISLTGKYILRAIAPTMWDQAPDMDHCVRHKKPAGIQNSRFFNSHRNFTYYFYTLFLRDFGKM